VYSLSIRETVRLCQGLNLPGFAWKGFNDEFVPGCEFEKAEPGNPMFERVQKTIAQRDRRCRWFPMFADYDIASVLIFKIEPDAGVKAELLADGYQFPKVHRNPYAT
jgi:hypothetical protein